MLQQRVDRGKISPSALVLKEGMPASRPLPLLFRIVAGAPAPHPLHALASASLDRKFLRWLCLAIVAVALAVHYTGLIDTDAAAPMTFAALRLATVALIAAAGIGAALLWWRAAKILDRAEQNDTNGELEVLRAKLVSGLSAKPAPEAARIYRWLLAQK